MNAPKRDWDSEFAYIRYLALITGEGARQMAAQRGWRKEMSTGPRDWQLSWDLELSVWDFRRRPILERLGCGAPLEPEECDSERLAATPNGIRPPGLEAIPAASPEAP